MNFYITNFSFPINLAILSNLLDIAPSNTPHVMYTGTYLLVVFLVYHTFPLVALSLLQVLLGCSLCRLFFLWLVLLGLLLFCCLVLFLGDLQKLLLACFLFCLVFLVIFFQRLLHKILYYLGYLFLHFLLRLLLLALLFLFHIPFWNFWRRICLLCLFHSIDPVQLYLF